MYHRVVALDTDVCGLAVPPVEFRKQLAHLRRHRRLMSLEDLGQAAASGDVPAGAVALTFDDGYLDNLTTASPLLQEFNAPATFFLTAPAIDGSREYWWDTLARVLLGDHRLPPTLDLHADGSWVRPTATPAQRLETYQAASGLLIRASLDDRATWLARIVEWSAVGDLAPRESHRPMLAHEVRQLAMRPGHTVGAHTVDHVWLPAQAPEVRRDQIVESAKRLERTTGHPVTQFSYPYGAVDDSTREEVAAAGITTAVTTEATPVPPAGDRLRLPRIEVRPGPFERFVTLLEIARP
jgi:peptidoglycan/xylan/chitin deacetylase (PgdA/CDA1 family)